MSILKNRTVLLFVIVCTFGSTHSWANDTSSGNIKYHMHKLFDSYHHARISFTLKEYEITNIHIRHMKEAIAAAQKQIPKYDKAGDEIDMVLFTDRIARLQNTASDFRDAVNYGAPRLAELFAQDIFDTCAACHKELKFDHLFIAPRYTTLFGEYMHKVNEHIVLARLDEKNPDGEQKVRKHVHLIDYYLGLLRTSIPGEGPSGVIMDSEAFERRIVEMRERLRRHTEEEKGIDLDYIRTSLNSYCVACHEPERIK